MEVNGKVSGGDIPSGSEKEDRKLKGTAAEKAAGTLLAHARSRTSSNRPGKVGGAWEVPLMPTMQGERKW